MSWFGFSYNKRGLYLLLSRTASNKFQVVIFVNTRKANNYFSMKYLKKNSRQTYTNPLKRGVLLVIMI